MSNTCINFKDLVANAIIELGTSKNINCIDMNSIINYASGVSDYLFKRKIISYISIDNEAYDEFKNDYNEYYDICDSYNCNSIITLKDNVSIEDLKIIFRTHMKKELIDAYRSLEALNELGIHSKNNDYSLVMRK